jgi:hypothetical protein
LALVRKVNWKVVEKLQQANVSYDAFLLVLGKLAAYCSNNRTTAIMLHARQRQPRTRFKALANAYDLELHEIGQSNAIGRVASQLMGSTAFLVLRDTTKLAEVFSEVSQQCQCAVFMVAAPVVSRILEASLAHHLPESDLYAILSTDETHAFFVYTEDSTTPSGDVVVQFHFGSEMPIADLL